MACVHPAALQLLQKPWESVLSCGSKVLPGGEAKGEVGGMQMASVGAREMTDLLWQGESVTLFGEECPTEEGGSVELCCGEEVPALC